jgi:hypothetical protein
MNKRNSRPSRWMDRWMDGWMVGWLVGWMDGLEIVLVSGTRSAKILSVHCHSHYIASSHRAYIASS